MLVLEMVGERGSQDFLATKVASDFSFIVIIGVKVVRHSSIRDAVFFVIRFILICLINNPFLPFDGVLITLLVLVLLVKVVVLLLASYSRSTASAGKV